MLDDETKNEEQQEETSPLIGGTKQLVESNPLTETTVQSRYVYILAALASVTSIVVGYDIG